MNVVDYFFSPIGENGRVTILKEGWSTLVGGSLSGKKQFAYLVCILLHSCWLSQLADSEREAMS